MITTPLSYFRIVLLFASAMVLMQTTHAQNYRISGKVFDGETGEPLPGASVIVKSSEKGISTDVKGAFELKGITQDQITLTVSYVGYKRYIMDHDFSDDPRLQVNIQLEPFSENINEVTIEGQATGQVEAMLEQKRAESIKNIISSEQVEQFPDMNAAEAMQRIPGITLQRDQGEGRYVQLRGTPPEYTSFQVNGEQIPSPEEGVRYVGMDIISADQIHKIEIAKVNTPDMDADAIGGAVNIVTKKANSQIPEIRASAAAGYNNLRQTNNSQLQFSYGQRYNGFGIYLNGSYFVNNYGSDNMEFEYMKSTFYGSQQEGINNYYMQYDEVQLRHYTITRERTGFSGTLDYKFNDNSFIYLRGMYNRFSDDELRRRKIYTLDDALSIKNYLYGGVEHDIKDRIKIQNLNSVNFGGEHNILEAKLDYEGAYSYASENQPDRLEAIFENPGQAVNIKFDMSNPDWPRAKFPQVDFTDNVFQYDQYEMEELLFQTVDVQDRNFTGKMNLQIPYEFNAGNGYVKFGGKVMMKDKEVDLWGQEYGNYSTSHPLYAGEPPELLISKVSDGFHTTNFLNKGYAMEAMPSPEKLREFYEFYPQFFRLDRDETREESFDGDYEVTEDVYATYFMIRHDIDRLRLIGGVRYENSNVNYHARKSVRDSVTNKYLSADTTHDERDLGFVMPQFQVRYELAPNFNLRAAITYTYSRPNLEDVVPFREEDRHEVSYGNPDLKYPRAMNLDLLAEKYIQGDGILSGGLFYKKIDNYIYSYVIRAHESNPGMGGHRNRIEIPLNGTEAFVYGGEFQAQFKLKFLPGFLEHFGVFSNYTYTLSKAHLYKRYPANDHQHRISLGADYYEYFNTLEEEVISLPGQAMHTTNLALFYDSDKIYAKISANYHDDYLNKLGEDPDFDEYYDEAWRLDFTANYSIMDNMKVFVDLVNLTNTPLKYYIGDQNRILQQEYYSWWGRIGLKFNY